MISYFERNGARRCASEENPAEWMLDITGAAPGSQCVQDWPEIWNQCDERMAVKAELGRLKKTLAPSLSEEDVRATNDPFAAGFGAQMKAVLLRVFQQYWRTPSYLYSKIFLCLLSVSTARAYTSDEIPNNSTL